MKAYLDGNRDMGLMFATRVVALALFAGLAQGVLVGCAHAARATDEPAAAGQHAASESMMVVDENGKRVEVKIVDGKVVTAKVNGKDVPAERVKREGELIIVVDENGKQILRMNTPNSDVDFDTGKSGVMVVAPDAYGKAPRVRIMQLDKERKAAAEMEAIAAMPRPDVMLGVKLGKVSGVLAKHLGVDGEKSALVLGVAKEMPAAAAGVKPYDVIVAINGDAIDSPMGLAKHLVDHKTKVGDAVKLTVYQAGAKRELVLNPVKMDSNAMSKAEWEMVDEEDAETPGTDIHAVPGLRMMPEMPEMPAMPPHGWQMPEGGMRWAPQEMGEMSPEIRERVQKAVEEAMKAARERPRGSLRFEGQDNTRSSSSGARRDAELKELHERMMRLEEMLREMQAREKK